QICRGGEIGLHRLHLAAAAIGEPPRQGCEPLLVAGDENKVVAALREAIGVDRAGAARCAGNGGGGFGLGRILGRRHVYLLRLGSRSFVRAINRPFRNCWVSGKIERYPSKNGSIQWIVSKPCRSCWRWPKPAASRVPRVSTKPRLQR